MIENTHVKQENSKEKGLTQDGNSQEYQAKEVRVKYKKRKTEGQQKKNPTEEKCVSHLPIIVANIQGNLQELSVLSKKQGQFL